MDMKTFIEGKLKDSVLVPKPTEAEKHELDDGRTLELDGVAFNGAQRFLHFESFKVQHVINRKYPSIEEQLDMLYWDKVNGTEKWKAAIDKIKTDNPKIDTSDMSKVKDEFGN